MGEYAPKNAYSPIIVQISRFSTQVRPGGRTLQQLRRFAAVYIVHGVLHQRIVQQKVQNPDVQHAIFVVPTLADIVTDYYHRERIAGQGRPPVENLASIIAYLL